jgi:hypothetical protein
VIVTVGQVKLDFVARKSLQMPKKSSAEIARHKNIAKALQKKKQDTKETRPGAWCFSMPAVRSSIAAEPPNGNDVTPPLTVPTHIPNPSPEWSTDLDPALDSEGDWGRHNKDVPHGAQERAVPTEHSRKHAPVTHFPGQSERTMSRKKLAHKKLLAQGFTTLPEFFRQKAEKDKQQARLNALVAAVARPRQGPRPNTQRLYIQDEDEEDEIIEITAERRNSEIASGSHNHKRTPEASVENDTAQPRGLDGVTSSRIVEVTPEPVQVKYGAGVQSEPSTSSDTMSGFRPFDTLESERAHCIRDPSISKSRQKASPLPLEETEESSNSCKTLSDDEEAEEPDSERPPGPSESEMMRHDLDDIQGILAGKLKALRHGNDPDDAGPQFALDNTMGRLRDLATLRTARKDLATMVEDKKKNSKTSVEGVLRGRVQAMVGMLNLFLDEGSCYTWRQVSLIVAKSQSHGVARARLIRRWVLSFLQNRELPHPKYSWTRSTALQDEDISQEIQFDLGERMKNGLLTATDLVEVVASPKMQEQFTHAGIDKPTISERTAHHWLDRLGWRYGKQHIRKT